MATNAETIGNLTGYQYVRLGQVISGSSMESIALGYLNITREKIKQLKEARRQDMEGFVIDVIEEWARRNVSDQVQVRKVDNYCQTVIVAEGTHLRAPLLYILN